MNRRYACVCIVQRVMPTVNALSPWLSNVNALYTDLLFCKPKFFHYGIQLSIFDQYTFTFVLVRSVLIGIGQSRKKT